MSDLDYEILREGPGLQPAPYFATRGMKWIQYFGGLSDDELKAYLTDSHEIVSHGLTKKKQRELGLNQD